MMVKMLVVWTVGQTTTHLETTLGYMKRADLIGKIKKLAKDSMKLIVEAVSRFFYCQSHTTLRFKAASKCDHLKCHFNYSSFAMRVIEMTRIYQV